MDIPDDILALMACPVCKKPVHRLASQPGLQCSACRRIYPVRDDILVMLPEEAILAGEGGEQFSDEKGTR